MTQEDKELLLRDLCARLPYNVMCEVIDSDENLSTRVFPLFPHHITYLRDHRFLSEDKDSHWKSFKPFLRPMSSMTEDERKEYVSLLEMCQCGDVYEYEVVDWLNEHHFDYRGLIEKGLAIEVTEENNPYEN